MTQTNVRQGDRTFLAGEDLSGKENYLVKLTHDGGTPEVLLPEAIDDQPLYLLLNGDTDGEVVDVRPLQPGYSMRIKFNGTGNPGDIVVLGDPTSDAGKIRKLPTDAGTYRGLGWLEEQAVDEQEALIRFCPQGNITVQ